MLKRSVRRVIVGSAKRTTKSIHPRTRLIHLMAPTIIYPSFARGNVVDQYPNNTKVADPYRALEDPDAHETVTFVDEQNKITDDYLHSFGESEELRSSVEKVYSYEKFSAPRQRRDDKWYWSYNPGLLSQSQIWRSNSQDRKDAELFFDPNVLSDDGTIGLSTTAFSETGKYFAYSTSVSGSDNQTIYVKETQRQDTREKLRDEIRFVKFSGIDWTHDDSGFVYHRYPEKDTSGTGTAADVNAMLCYHQLGTDQSQDLLLHKDEKHPEHMFGGEITYDGDYLVITASEGTAHKNKLTIVPLEGKKIVPNMRKEVIVDDFHASFDYVVNFGTRFLFKTNENAPREKLVYYDLDNQSQGFVDLVPEHEKDVLCSCQPVHDDKLILTYTHDVKDQVSLWNAKTGTMEKRLALPVGAVYYTSCNHDSKEDFFVALGSFLSPVSIYKYSFAAESVVLYRSTEVEGIVPSEYATEQVFYTSKDGTKVPMFITGKLGLKGPTPTILYGYGGFEISLSPVYSPFWVTFMKHFNGRVAVANIRGGGEYGSDWWEAAIRDKRQNAFDDFQYAAKYLSDQGYTSPTSLAIYGGSNGGLLCGVCLNQTPELYGAVMAAVGVMDMLRFHKFTIGAAWISDYGSPDDPEMFDYIKGYSPLHNVDAEKTYPATLLLTADHDDRFASIFFWYR